MAESKVGQAAMDAGVALAFVATGAASDADLFANAINAHGFTNIVASVDASNRLVIEHNDGGEMRIKDTSSAFANAGFTAYNYTTKLGTANLYSPPQVTRQTMTSKSKLEDLNLYSWQMHPTALTTDGRLWYSPNC